jgi:hypothetical protein
VRKQHPPDCANDRVKTVVRFIRQKRKREQRLPGVPPCGDLDGRQMLPESHIDRLVHRSENAAMKDGASRMPTTISVHSHAGDSTVHPNSRSNVKAAGTRLRRRLSKIFHCDSIDSGFRSLLPSGPLTYRLSHPASCQSPRIQRRRRATSAL